MKPSHLIFQQLFESKSSTFTYLLADSESKEALLIDSVLETVERDLNLINELGLTLKYVLDTHVHADHVTGAGEIRSRMGVKTASAMRANVPCADMNLRDGDVIKFGGFSLTVLETPGHTDASLSFLCEGMVFTGDALLIRGCGRTDFQSGSADILFDSVTGKLFRLPPETRVFPAHDYKGFTSSTIEAEVKNNPRLGQGRTKEQFRELMSNLKLDYPKQIDIAVPANMACGTVQTDETKVPVISAEELATRLQSNILIVDVRPPTEFQGELGHIAEAHQITLGADLQHFLEGYDRNEALVFVCRSGRRSEQATQLAIELGFKKASNLVGGMLRWNEIGLPTERQG